MERTKTIHKMTIRSLIVAFVSVAHSNTFSQDQDEKSIVHMQLELQLDSPRCVEFENVTFVLRIVNPNDFSVSLRGFEFGYVEPEMRGTLPNDGEFHRLYYGPMDSPYGPDPIRLSPHASLERHRFLFSSFMPDRWPPYAGKCKLKAASNVSEGWTGDGKRPVRIEWTSNVVDVDVRPGTARDRDAYAFLKSAFGDTGSLPDPRIDIYADFLEKFGETAYSPEIRHDIALDIQRFLTASDREWTEKIQPKLARKRQELVKIWSDCVTACLDNGPPFADDFLEETTYPAHSLAFRVALHERATDLARRLASEFDKTKSHGEEGRLFRAVLVLSSLRQDREAAQNLNELRTRFPKSELIHTAKYTLSELGLPSIDDGPP